MNPNAKLVFVNKIEEHDSKHSFPSLNDIT